MKNPELDASIASAANAMIDKTMTALAASMNELNPAHAEVEVESVRAQLPSVWAEHGMSISEPELSRFAELLADGGSFFFEDGNLVGRPKG